MQRWLQSAAFLLRFSRNHSYWVHFSIVQNMKALIYVSTFIANAECVLIPILYSKNIHLKKLIYYVFFEDFAVGLDSNAVRLKPHSDENGLF